MATRLRELPLPTYEGDAAGWAIAQAAALRDQRIDLLDWENLAEEIADVAGRERDKMESALRLVLSHMLKWEYQPMRRSRSWFNTVNEQRRRVTRQLRENPSLRHGLPKSILESYADAKGEASVDMDAHPRIFPAECPYSFDEIMTRPIEWDGELA